MSLNPEQVRDSVSPCLTSSSIFVDSADDRPDHYSPQWFYDVAGVLSLKYEPAPNSSNSFTMMVSFESCSKIFHCRFSTNFQVHIFGEKCTGQFDITGQFESCLTQLAVELQVLVEQKCPVAYLDLRSVHTMWIPSAKTDHRLFGRAMRPDYVLERNYGLSFSCPSLLKLAESLDILLDAQLRGACTKFCEVQKAVHKITDRVSVLVENAQKLQQLFGQQREAMLHIDLKKPAEIQQTLEKVNSTCSSVDRSMNDLMVVDRLVDWNSKTREIKGAVADLGLYKFLSYECDPEDNMLFNQFMLEVLHDSLKEAEGRFLEHAEIMSSRCLDLSVILRDLKHLRGEGLKQRLLEAVGIVKFIDSLPDKLEDSLEGVSGILLRRYLFSMKQFWNVYFQ